MMQPLPFDKIDAAAEHLLQPRERIGEFEEAGRAFPLRLVEEVHVMRFRLVPRDGAEKIELPKSESLQLVLEGFHGSKDFGAPHIDQNRAQTTAAPAAADSTEASAIGQ